MFSPKFNLSFLSLSIFIFRFVKPVELAFAIRQAPIYHPEHPEAVALIAEWFVGEPAHILPLEPGYTGHVQHACPPPPILDFNCIQTIQ